MWNSRIEDLLKIWEGKKYSFSYRPIAVDWMVFDAEFSSLVRYFDDVAPGEVIDLLSLAIDTDAVETVGNQVQSAVFVL